MSRARWIALLFCTLVPAPAAAAETPKPPNVILITGDTLRADHLGAYGNKRAVTPAIDRIAKMSVRFTNASTPFPRTTPALASLMTGLWPQHHGSREVSDPFTDGTTLAQVFLKNGYATFGVSANWVASRKQNMQLGFHGFISMKRMKTSDRGQYVTDRALKLSRLAEKDKPLFLWAHYMDPHFPYNPPKSFGGPPGESCKKIMRRISKKKLRLSVVQGNRGGLGEKTLRHCKQLYDAEIAYMDWQIGRLLRGLESDGRLENVILVFASDHGEAFGDAGLFYEHGSTLHNAIVRVPLLITAPGVKAGVDHEVIRLQDVAPTILSLAGLPESAIPETDGVDQSWRLGTSPRPKDAKELIAVAESGSALLIGTFSQPFEGHTAARNCVHGPRYSLCTLKKKGTALYDRQEDPQLSVDVSEQQPEHLAILTAARERWTLGEARQRAAWNRRFKLVEYPRLEGGYRRALYDLETDPTETENVIAAHPEVAAQLDAELRAWSASIPSNAPPPERDEEQLEMLRALGYVD
jgi:arylsulfatase